MSRVWPALAAAVALAACGDGPRALDLAAARDVSLTLTLREDVSWRGREPSKTLSLSLRGTAAREGGGEVLTCRVAWAELRYVAADGTVQELATDGTREDPLAGEAIARARRALLEGLVDRDVVLRFETDASSGAESLAAVEGLADALAASRAGLADVDDPPAEVIDVAADGLTALLDDEQAREGLRAAGLASPPAHVARPGTEVARVAAVHVEGYGWTDVALHGRAGEGRGSAPTVHLEGRPGDAPSFRPEAGPEPPPGIGPVRVDGIRVEAETEHHPDSLRPQRGRVTAELPHAGGPLVRRTTEFVLVVRE